LTTLKSSTSTFLPVGTSRDWDVSPAVDWDDTNPSSGTFIFTGLDAFIAVHPGQDLIHTLGRTPAWASSKPSAPGTYKPGECAPPTNISDWDAYVTAIVTHAAGRIKYWEIWNEAQDPNFYCGDIPSMVAMAKDAYAIIHQVQPGAQVLSPSVTGVDGPGWFKSYLAAGGGQYADIIAFHGYWLGVAETLPTIVAGYRVNLDPKPIWDTEASGASGGSKVPTAQQQADFLAKYYLLHWSLGIPRFVWYAYDASPQWGQLYNGTSMDLAGTAFQQVYDWMVGAQLVSPCSTLPNNTWFCLLKRNGYSAQVIWNSSTPISLAVAYQFTEYRDLQGNIHPILNHTVPIGSTPILIETGPIPL
jgi:hypothetical protein